MPFFKQIQNELGTLCIWQLTEKPTELLPKVQLPANDEKRFAEITSEKRKTEFLATRMLLQELFGYTPEIDYNRWGKPAFSNRKEHLSISHSADFAAVFISNRQIGVDVELETRNIERVSNRFLHPEELAFIRTLGNQQRAKIIYWSAKEAIFKCSNIHGILFSEQIKINPFPPETDQTFTATLTAYNKSTSYQLHTLFFENNVLVYCVEL